MTRRRPPSPAGAAPPRPLLRPPPEPLPPDFVLDVARAPDRPVDSTVVVSAVSVVALRAVVEPFVATDMPRLVVPVAGRHSSPVCLTVSAPPGAPGRIRSPDGGG